MESLRICLSQSTFFHLVSNLVKYFIYLFFLKGNSNSFVRIDISSGCVGIPIYFAMIHGILIYLWTYGNIL